MTIKTYVLTRTIEIRGKNIWGFNSKLILTPSKKPGCYILDKVTGIEMPLNRDNIKCSNNNLYAVNGKQTVHVLEHILALRWLGFTNFSLSGSSWPPTLTTKELWDYLLLNHAIRKTNEYVEGIVVLNPGVSFIKKKNGNLRQTFVGPNPISITGGEGIINVFIDYPGIGKKEKRYRIDDFLKIYNTYPQGFPKYRYTISKFLKMFIGWPHLNKVIWPQLQSEKETLEMFADHRALDIFGALAAIDYQKLPFNFFLDSKCSGHLFDLLAIRGLRYR